MDIVSPPTNNSTGNLRRSPSKDVRDKASKAKELESRLLTAVSSSTPAAKNESNIQKLRIELCEVFSDILLDDPFYSNRKDISGRMWRACFHVRVQELRERIAKETARLKKIQHKSKSQSSINPGPDEELERQHKILIEHLESSLKKFLKEAIVLYEFLIDKYQGFLLPQFSSQISQTPLPSMSMIDSDSNKIDDDPNPALEGVVPLLHKLLIHLGDLFRYSNLFTEAETAYLKATRLAPGRGNAYNQLAVIGQIKETKAPLSMTVLYWYCRSLLATDDSFPTAMGNMERFFILKFDESKADQDKDKDTTLQSSTAGLNREKARELKGIRNRKFLQAFTLFHGQLFFTLSKKENSQDDLRLKLMDAASAVDSLLSQLDWLLEESAFSDALLNKLVVVSISSIWNLLYAEHKIKYQYTMIALTWLLNFATKLIHHFIPLLVKVLTKHTSQGIGVGMSLTVRFLTPILFIFEFKSSLWRRNEKIKILWESYATNEDWDQADQEWRMKYDQGLTDFWSHIVQVANVIRSLNIGDDSVTAGDPADQLPIDYGEMKGFLPFESFLSESSEAKAETVLSPKEAVVALQLDTLNSQTKSRGDGEAEFSSKIRRFLFLIRHSSHEVETNLDGTFRCRLYENLNRPCTIEHDEESMLHVDPTMMEKLLDDEDDGAGDDVVYKVSAIGTSLLVPNVSHEVQPPPSLTTKNTVRPPPGFLPIDGKDYQSRSVPLTPDVFSSWNSGSITPQTNLHTFSSNPFVYPMPTLGQDTMNREENDQKAISFHPFQFSSPFSLLPMNSGDEGFDQRPLFTHNPFF